MSTGQSSFQERIARVTARHDQMMARRPSAPINSVRENVKYPLSLVAAVVIGMVCAIAGRYVQFHMLGLPAHMPDGDLQLIADNVFAGMIVAVIRMATNFSSREHMACKMLGVWIMILGFHNLVHWMPDFTGLLFSGQYVNEMVRATDANTLIFRGLSFYF